MFFLCGFQAVRGLLDNPNEPVNDLSYFDCIESVMENSKVTTTWSKILKILSLYVFSLLNKKGILLTMWCVIHMCVVYV